MKKFVLRLLLFCLAPLPALYLLAHVVDKGLQRSRHYFYSEWNDIYSGNINADMLVMGTSRAWVHMSPRILDSALQLNSYNLGMDGAVIRLQYERLKIYLRHNRRPKYIIQEVGYNSTFITNNGITAPQQYLPYLYDTAVWRLTQSSDAPFSIADRYFPLYKYNNELPLIKEGILSYMGRGVKSMKYKGYEGKDLVWDNKFEDFVKQHPNGVNEPVDEQAVALFTDYLNFCKANDIKVIFVFPPVYHEALKYAHNLDAVLSVIKSLSAAYNIPFYNYMSDPLCYSTDNFYNSQHLNRHAAEIFTRELAQQIAHDRGNY